MTEQITVAHYVKSLDEWELTKADLDKELEYLFAEGYAVLITVKTASTKRAA